VHANSQASERAHARTRTRWRVQTHVRLYRITADGTVGALRAAVRPLPPLRGRRRAFLTPRSAPNWRPQIVKELGAAVLPGFVISSGYSFLGPAGLPQAVTDKLNAALAQTVRDPVIRKKLIDMGADPIANTPQEHAAYIRSEVEKWQRVAKSAGIKPE
jgi:hypothetical protein